MSHVAVKADLYIYIKNMNACSQYRPCGILIDPFIDAIKNIPLQQQKQHSFVEKCKLQT